jgi:hypothetical protein
MTYIRDLGRYEELATGVLCLVWKDLMPKSVRELFLAASIEVKTCRCQSKARIFFA